MNTVLIFHVLMIRIFDDISDEIEYMKLDLEPEYKRTRLMYFDLIVLKA